MAYTSPGVSVTVILFCGSTCSHLIVQCCIIAVVMSYFTLTDSIHICNHHQPNDRGRGELGTSSNFQYPGSARIKKWSQSDLRF